MGAVATAGAGRQVTLALSEAGERAAALALAAAAALLVWLVLLAVLAFFSRPRRPVAVGATSEFGGTEPPAVVCLLADGWTLGREAVPATLLDLAARGEVAIEQVAHGRFICRLCRRPAGAPDLLPYERQVLDHVRGQAVDGVVPCEALTTGPEEQSRGWWKEFEKEVRADARRRGLSRSRWSRAALTALTVVAFAPAALAAAALVATPDDSDSDNDSPVEAFLGLTAIAWGALMAVPLSMRAERDTPEGLIVAGRWLGLRRYLQDNEAFDSAPPPAVAIWDRYLSYGAALGVAAGAVRGLPLGSESDTEAWSAYGGRWRVVRVRYPSRVPPGWGQKPLVVAAKGLGVLVVAGLVALTVGPVLVEAVSGAGPFGDDWQPWALIPLALFGVMLVGLATLLVRSACMLGLGLSDLAARGEVEGLVIRLRDGYLAVDDGQSDRVRAWRVEPLKLGGVGRGSVVRAVVSPRLGYVHSLAAVVERPTSVL